MLYSFRNVNKQDIPLICQFPQNEKELYMCFPKAEYPLTVVQLTERISQRHSCTVILYKKQVIGFANLYKIEQNKTCSIGNVMIHPEFRGKGAGKSLVKRMIKIAVKEYKVKDVRLACFNENVPAILLYHKLGFKPYDIEERAYKKQRIVLIRMKKEV